MAGVFLPHWMADALIAVQVLSRKESHLVSDQVVGFLSLLFVR